MTTESACGDLSLRAVLFLNSAMPNYRKILRQITERNDAKLPNSSEFSACATVFHKLGVSLYRDSEKPGARFNISRLALNRIELLTILTDGFMGIKIEVEVRDDYEDDLYLGDAEDILTDDESERIRHLKAYLDDTVEFLDELQTRLQDKCDNLMERLLNYSEVDKTQSLVDKVETLKDDLTDAADSLDDIGFL